MSDFDAAWKEAMDRFFERFVAFFLPLIHAMMDWKRDFEPLDTESQAVAAQAEVGRRRADKLFKLWKAAGDAAFLHVEVQCQKEAEFERRMHVYNYRAEDVVGHGVISVAFLGDDDPNWRPSRYVYEDGGCQRTLSWQIVKLLDYRGREEELLRDTNPFGLLVVAHLRNLDTRKDPEARQKWKLRLLLALHEKGLDGEDVRQWYRLIDWLLPLPAVLDKQVWLAVRLHEEDKQVPFISYLERHGAELEQEFWTGKGWRNSILAVVRNKFRDEGVQIYEAAAKPIAEADLEKLLLAVVACDKIEDLRQLLPPRPTEPTP